MIQKAFILGAGLGKRLAPLTLRRPKPTLEILGRPLMDYIFEHVKSAGVREVVINTHHYPEKYEELFGKGEKSGLKIQYSYEEILLDTGGGLKKAQALLGNQTLLMYNGDILTDGDLSEAIEHHRSTGNLATLILGKFNANQNVNLNAQGQITDLRGVLGDKDNPKFVFTGIQIVEPALFQHIPEGQIISIVDVYLDLIRQGLKIGGHVWKDCYWTDIGDLKAYQQAQADVLHGKCKTPFPLRRLGQDGSDRIYYRAGRDAKTNIIMRYGHEKEENSYFVRIASFLKDLDLSVPEVLYSDPDSGLAVVEDLGDMSLCHAVESFSHDQIIKFYQNVLREIHKLHQSGVKTYDSEPFLICPAFTEKTYRWESRYFEEHMLEGFLKIKLSDEEKEKFEEDCGALAKRLSQEPTVLIHRDLQSKNIMIKEGVPYFIDFQGMRLGLAQYDLASLILDPYVDLESAVKEDLFEYYMTLASAAIPNKKRFKELYFYCALQRLMQALGAYGFLGVKKGKKHFLQYIQPALERLTGVLADLGGFEGLKSVVQKAGESSSLMRTGR
jgi:NDP-sugar pyrophosphorylase family protein/tRNA A-37 threonylcarbamoyl transferase component Bud32